MKKIRIGSRGSLLAVTQTEWIGRQLQALYPGLAVEYIRITTTGDKDQHSALSSMGGKGVFVKEIEDALFSNQIDLAVHSLKDVPQSLPYGLELGPFPEREDPRDAVISRFGELIEELPKGSTIGTSSPRRRAQILHRFRKRQYSLTDFRGNLDTRIKKCQQGDVDATVVALAGLKRLGLDKEVSQILEPHELMPAPGQGCLGLEIRSQDDEIKELLGLLRHESSDIWARAERSFLQALGAGCLVPVGTSVSVQKGRIQMHAILLNVEGTKRVDVEEEGDIDQAELIGAKCAGRLIAEGSDLL